MRATLVPDAIQFAFVVVVTIRERERESGEHGVLVDAAATPFNGIGNVGGTKSMGEHLFIVWYHPPPPCFLHLTRSRRGVMMWEPVDAYSTNMLIKASTSRTMRSRSWIYTPRLIEA